MRKITHRWTRLASKKWQDAWEERLRFVDPCHLALTTWPSSRALKIEVFCDQPTGDQLVREFGGRLTRMHQSIWTGDPLHPRAPISIRGKLRIFSSSNAFSEWSASKRQPPGILIPASMAFGTGEHATTATCLRLIHDHLPPPGFTAADLGCGSGILGIACEKWGANAVFACDNDPSAVRIARNNRKANSCRKLKIERADVLRWNGPDSCDLAVANLYSDLLIRTLPRISRMLRHGGAFVYSGVLLSQSDEVREALEQAGFKESRLIARGKWCAGAAHYCG